MLFLVIFVLILTLIWKNFGEIVAFKRRLDFSKTIPGPAVFELFRISRKTSNILGWMHSNAQKHGKVFRLWFGQDLQLYFSDPDDVQALLSSNDLLHKSKIYDLVVPWQGRGLLTNSGKSWHQMRKLVTPAFHFKILSTFKEPIEDNCDILIDQLNKVADGRTTVDLYPYINLFTLDVICETAMGIKKNAQLNKDSVYVQSLKLVLQLFQDQLYTPWKRIPFLYNLTNDGRKLKAAIRILHDETYRVIKVRRSLMDVEPKLDQTNKSKEDEEMYGTKRRLAFLDSMLILQKENGVLTDANIQEEVGTFMFAGHDTNSSVIGFTLYLLSQHGEVQQRAFEEAVELKGNEAETMPYLEAIIKETLRLYAPVPILGRRVVKPIQVGNMTIPTGTFVSALVYTLHRNPKIYPEPEKFDPERYLHGNIYHPFANVAFSAGPRNCIGQKFAFLELKCTLSKMLRAFELLPAPGFKVKPVLELLLKSENGMQVQLRKRNL